MSKASQETTNPPAARPQLRLLHYGGSPTWPDRPALGLKALVCPQCGHDGQRLIRANQSWRDQSDYFCAQIAVTMDFRCTACEQGWQISLFNEDEGEGEIILEVKLVETVSAEDTRKRDGETAST
jgi:hypothetical protein